MTAEERAEYNKAEVERDKKAAALTKSLGKA